ncbi:MAG: CHAT domain-containing protein, partial [Bacteroidota bacterium]
EISYAYSVSHLIKNNSLERNNENGFLGVAPERFSDPGLSILKNSAKEVTSACNVMNGELFIGEEASKEHFLDQMDQYQTIHLSTHANSGSSDSTWISFRDQKLSGNEIYGEKNDAELIVLSACRTSLGEMIAGEGIMSLSRAFFHAGAASVLSTLWNVNDQVSVGIIADFYQALVTGKSRAAALRTAKLNYLSSHSGSGISPYFWSSYIMIGDGGKLNLQSSKTSSTPLLISVFLILGIIVFIVLMRKKSMEAKNT